MKLRLFIITCYTITCSLSLNDDPKPHIIFPEKGKSICIIGNSDCIQPLKRIQWYMTYILNVERSKVTKGQFEKLPIATNMLFMETDEILINKSQEYAENCLINKNMQSCPPPGENETGEVSVFVTEYERSTEENASSRVAEVLMGLRLEVKRFSKEALEQLVKEYRPSETEPSFYNLVKFIQADVWKVGCGIADFLISNNKFKEVIVCSYGPPKLETGKALYIAGCIPCSNCPGETLCERNTLNGLCRVNSGKLPVFDKHKWEKKICLKPEEASSNPPIKRLARNINEHAGKSVVWEIPKDLNTQQCKGTNLCPVPWTYENGQASMDMDKVCLSVMAFQAKLYIEENSCFIFYYKKLNFHDDVIETNAQSIIAFAFEHNNLTDIRINEQIYTQNKKYFEPIYLNLPWRNTYIHVGFGTRSYTPKSWYFIDAKDFAIEKGECLKPEENTLQ